MKFAKLASTLCQIVNEPVQNGQSFITQHQSGEISANLVTLPVSRNEFKVGEESPFQKISFDHLCIQV